MKILVGFNPSTVHEQRTHLFAVDESYTKGIALAVTVMGGEVGSFMNAHKQHSRFTGRWVAVQLLQQVRVFAVRRRLIGLFMCVVILDGRQMGEHVVSEGRDRSSEVGGQQKKD